MYLLALCTYCLSLLNATQTYIELKDAEDYAGMHLMRVETLALYDQQIPSAFKSLMMIVHLDGMLRHTVAVGDPRLDYERMGQRMAEAAAMCFPECAKETVNYWGREEL